MLQNVGNSVVTIHPIGGVISAAGGNARFLCISAIPYGERGLSIEWFMNESVALVSEAIGQGHAVAYVMNRVQVLDFIKIPLGFNKTRIQCNALISSGEQFSSAPVTLQLQGELYYVISILSIVHNN